MDPNSPCSLTDQQKLDLLQKHRMPGFGFTFPMAQKRHKVYLSMEHLSEKHDCFKYSFVMKGFLCVPCVLLGGGEVANDRKIYKVEKFCCY